MKAEEERQSTGSIRGNLFRDRQERKAGLDGKTEETEMREAKRGKYGAERKRNLKDGQVLARAE